MRHLLLPQYCVGLLACLLLLGFGTIKPFSLLAISGDNHLVLAYAKSAIDGYGFRFTEALGFPGQQDNLFNPSFDFSFRLFLRIVGVFSSSAAASYYLMYVTALSGMYVASAYTLRQFGFRHVTCIVASVCYVVSSYFVFRSLGHDFLSLYFAVPLGVLLAFRLSDQGEEISRVRLLSVSTIVCGFLVATSGLYYAFFSCLFIMFHCASSAFSSLRIRPVLNGFTAVVAIFVILILSGFGTGIFDVLMGRVPMVVRYPGEQMVYGLSLAEGTQVFEHIPVLKKLFSDYGAFLPYIKTTTGLWEWPGVILTPVILLAPMICAALARLEQRTGRQNLVLTCSISIVFALLFTVNGGLGFYFNSLIAPSIRAMARIMPFLSFYALIIFCALVDGLMSSRQRSWQFMGIAALSALAASIYPNVGGLARKQAIAMSTETQANLNSVANVLLAKDKHEISHILQLPHYSWPEVADQNGFDPYSMQDYFILDKKGSQTKWSYGGYLSQSSYLTVRDLINDHKAGGLSCAARAVGFNGVLIEKRPMAKDEFDSFARVLSDRSSIAYEDERRVLYKLSDCEQ